MEQYLGFAEKFYDVSIATYLLPALAAIYSAPQI